MSSGNLMYFILCTLPLVLSLITTEKVLVLSVLHFPVKYLYALMRSLLSLLQVEQSQLHQPFHMGATVLNHLCDSLQCVHVFLALGSPRLDTLPQT